MPHFHSTSTYPGIYSYVTASEENNNNTQQEVVIEPVDVKSLGMEDFFNICLNNYLQETDREEIEAKLNLSMEDEQFFVKMFQKSYLKKTSDEINDYIDKEINKSVDKALEGDLAGAYNNFLKFTMFTENENAYIYSKEGENSPQKLPQYMEQKLQNIPSLLATMKIIKNLTDMNSFIAYNRSGAHTPINPYLTISNLEKLSESLSEDQMSKEQKAKMYFLASQMFKERSVYGIESLNSDGLHYAEKAISFSSDYNLISNSLRNLDKKYDKKNVKDAYKRAIIKAEKEKNYNHVYAINKKMVEIYESEKGAGYSISSEVMAKIERYHNQAIIAMKKTENHSKEEVNNELRKLFNIQLKNGNIKGAIKSKTEIANNLKGKDKYNALISIIGIAGEGQLQYVNKISTLISKDKMSAKDKNELLQTLLSETKGKVQDPEKREKGMKVVDKQITYNNLFITQRPSRASR